MPGLTFAPAGRRPMHTTPHE